MREVCLVVPCFNEERRLNGDSFHDFLASRPHAHVCFVNDGSRDGTLEALQALAARIPERMLLLSLPRRRGKAEAVRQGALHASTLGRFAFIGYWDADLSTPLSELDRLLAVFEAGPEYLLAMGSRVKRLGSQIDRRAIRHFLGRIFSTCASPLLHLPVYDSQCGAKVFRSDLTSVIFADPFVSKWLFDLEILVRLRKHLGFEPFLRAAIEVPLTSWREVKGSKLNLTEMFEVPYDLLRIRREYLRDHRASR